MKEILGLTGELISPIESSDSGHLAFASLLDSVGCKTPYILRLTGKTPLNIEQRQLGESRTGD